MDSMNGYIFQHPDQFPAVHELDMKAIGAAAGFAAARLTDRNFTHLTLEPNDGTRYEFAIVLAPGEGAPFRFASSMGRMYPWMGTDTIHPDYAREHYVADGNPWTATVIALFLNAVGRLLELNLPTPTPKETP